MDVILHVGAHRTGTSTFQDYMQRHAKQLAAAGMACWGPEKIRAGSLGAADPASTKKAAKSDESTAHIVEQVAQMRDSGVKTLLVNDPDMMGSMRETLEAGVLYPGAGDRIARLIRAFDGQVSRIVISPRSLDMFWRSVASAGVVHGAAVPERDALMRIARATRSWRDVITEVSKAAPGVEIRVLPFEAFCGRPDALLAAGSDREAPVNIRRQWLSRAPTLPELRRSLAERAGDSDNLPFGMNVWSPFTSDEYAALREAYADDMMWLVAGAGGLATLTEGQPRTRAAPTSPAGSQTKGHGNELGERKVARPG